MVRKKRLAWESPKLRYGKIGDPIVSEAMTLAESSVPNPETH